MYLQPAVHATLGYIAIRDGKSKNAKRNLSLTVPAADMLKGRKAAAESDWVFPGEASPDVPFLGTSLDQQHDRARKALKLPKDFVVHSLRHTMLTHLGEAGADAFTIMRIAGHSTVTVSQRYVHPTPENLERAFGRLEELNAMKRKQAEAEAKAQAAAVGAEGSRVPTKVPTVKKGRVVKFRVSD